MIIRCETVQQECETVQQERVPKLGVTVVNTINDWLNPSTIKLTWDNVNLYSQYGSTVTIQLMGYSNVRLFFHMHIQNICIREGLGVFLCVCVFVCVCVCVCMCVCVCVY